MGLIRPNPYSPAISENFQQCPEHGPLQYFRTHSFRSLHGPECTRIQKGEGVFLTCALQTPSVTQPGAIYTEHSAAVYPANTQQPLTNAASLK